MQHVVATAVLIWCFVIDMIQLCITYVHVVMVLNCECIDQYLKC